MSQAPARRLLVHAGFHKTGTTTAQDTLARNGTLLMPHVEIYLQQGALLSPLSDAVLDFSGNRCKETKQIIFERAKAFFALIDLTDPRPVLISSESLAGHFPGSSGVSKYAPAPIAIALILEAWAEVTGSIDGFELYYSTRRDGWLKSCHWQRLKINRLKLSLEDYETRFAEAADLEQIVEDVRARLPRTKVHSAALEDLEHPVDPILELLNLTHLKPEMTFPENANVFLGEEARQQLLELNRSDIWGDAFQRAQYAILNPT